MASLRFAEGFAALRQTTRQLVNKTTSGAVVGTRELRIYGITEGFAALRQTTRQLVNKTTSEASLRLRFASQTTRQRVNETTSGASQGYANASPDYETTSQQDNKWGFARLRFASQTTRQLVIASLRLRLASQTTRLLVNKTTSGAR